MKATSLFRTWTIPAVAILIVIISVAWAASPKSSADFKPYQDTIPAKKRSTNRQPGDKDLDKEMRELEKAKAHLDALKEKDWEKMKQDIEESIKKIDFDKIKLQAEESIHKVDMEKIQKEIDESFSKIDFEKIEKDVEKAMKEVESSLKEVDVSKEMEKAKKEIQKAKLEMDEQLKNKDWKKELDEEMKKINLKEVEKEMENARIELDLAKSNMNLDKIKMKEELDKAKIDIDKAMEELKGYQEMIYSMEKEGLLNTKEDYRIEYRDGELIINGKKQSQDVMIKYKKYFKKDKMTIYKKDGDFHIDID